MAKKEIADKWLLELRLQQKRDEMNYHGMNLQFMSSIFLPFLVLLFSVGGFIIVNMKEVPFKDTLVNLLFLCFLITLAVLGTPILIHTLKFERAKKEMTKLYTKLESQI